MFDANEHVTLLMRPYAADSPPLPGTDNFRRAQKCAMHWLRSTWFARLFLRDMSEREGSIFGEQWEALRAALVAEKPERTRAVFVTDDDELRRQPYQTAQLDDYLIREF